MGIRMVRQPSQTPNVTNIDDIIPFRYAYGDQNGYVIGKGNEISHTIDGSTFRINSGRVVLQGVETDIDANGVSFTIDNSSETRYFVVYYEVNLATQTTSIKLSNYDTVGYPNIDLGDDLTANSSGIARLPLYSFVVTNGIIETSGYLGVRKLAKGISYYNGQLITDFKDLGGYINITQDEYEVATASSGDVLKFNISAPNGLSVNVFSTTDVIRTRMSEGLNLWKRLSTCSESSTDFYIKQIEVYVNIKYNNGKVYIKGFKYNNETKSESHSNCYLTSIYKVSEV